MTLQESHSGSSHNYGVRFAPGVPIPVDSPATLRRGDANLGRNNPAQAPTHTMQYNSGGMGQAPIRTVTYNPGISATSTQNLMAFMSSNEGQTVQREMTGAAINPSVIGVVTQDIVIDINVAVASAYCQAEDRFFQQYVHDFRKDEEVLGFFDMLEREMERQGIPKKDIQRALAQSHSIEQRGGFASVSLASLSRSSQVIMIDEGAATTCLSGDLV